MDYGKGDRNGKLGSTLKGCIWCMKFGIHPRLGGGASSGYGWH